MVDHFDVTHQQELASGIASSGDNFPNSEHVFSLSSPASGLNLNASLGPMQRDQGVEIVEHQVPPDVWQLLLKLNPFDQSETPQG